MKPYIDYEDDESELPIKGVRYLKESSRKGAYQYAFYIKRKRQRKNV